MWGGGRREERESGRGEREGEGEGEEEGEGEGDISWNSTMYILYKEVIMANMFNINMCSW